MAIYKMFMFRPSEAWYQLSKDAQAELLGKVNAALTQVGGKRIIACDSSWASEKWHTFGVEEFPTIEAVQAHTKLLTELDLYYYIVSTTLLGTEAQPS
jgi:hypothetical protein